MADRTHKIRSYPTEEQEPIMLQTVGTSRYTYNWGLATWDQWYQDYKDGKVDTKPSAFGLCNRWTYERPEWAKKTCRVAQQRALINLGKAFTNFWRGYAKRPKFKKKGHCREAFYVDNAHAYIKDGYIQLPGIGKVKLAEELRYEGKIISYTISHEADKWFVSVQVQGVEIPHTMTGSTCGVDVGMKTPAVCSDGTKLVLPEVKLHKLEKARRRHQRVVSRRKKASNRRKKALLRVQKIQVKINNIRCDAIHKFTTSVCKNHDTVVIEDLDAASMHTVSNRNIRSGLQRSCMCEIRRQLEYKAYHLVKADKWYPSTQLCSNCGTRQKLTIDQRTYHCPHCGLELDRDLNAALNLSHYPGSPG